MLPPIGIRRFTLTTALVLLAVVTPRPYALRPAATGPSLHPAVVFARAAGVAPDAVATLNEQYGGALLLASEIYEGIDLVLHRADGEPDYDLVVRPNARTDRIRVWVAGAERLEIDDHGDLVVHKRGRRIRQPRPIAYQDTPAGRIDVRADFRIGPDGDVRFAVGKYDRDRPLVISPSLSFPAPLTGTPQE